MRGVQEAQQAPLLQVLLVRQVGVELHQMPLPGPWVGIIPPRVIRGAVLGGMQEPVVVLVGPALMGSVT